MALTKRLFETIKGTRQWGFIHIPADKTKKYPVVIFCHGLGEIGKTEAEADKLLVHGPLKFLSEDRIIIAIQHHSWSFPPERIPYVLTNDPDVKAYGNGKVMITGLSAGGAVVVEVMKRFHNPNYVYVPMSPAIGAINTYPAGPYKVWGFVGNSDKTTQGALPGLYDMQNKIGAKVTVYSGGHGGWNTFYDPTYREEGKNIYEWAFGEIVAPPIDPPIEPPVQPPATKTIAKMLVTYSDGTTEEVINSAK